jgi:hypothetical protein
VDTEGVFAIGAGTRIRFAGDPALLHPIAEILAEPLRRTLGIRCPIGACEKPDGGGGVIQLILDGSNGGIPPQGYTLSLTPSGISVTGADAAGLFYATATLIQAIRQCEGRIPCGRIQDSPDFPTRGIMLDISRDKVPTMEELFSLVDLFAELKINHFQLYTEHTFAYSGHREVWAGASAMTAEEILRLDAYCKTRFIELVPNQNSFGHLNRWLAISRYRYLAECPDGFTWPWGGKSSQPFSLDPSNPASFIFLEELFAELLPHFTSRLFNVGCDETWDLGQGKNRDRCAKEGKGRVYLEFLLKIHELVKRHERTMLFWGDIIMQHPELVPELPRDVIALDWGYEAEHPFAEHSARFAGSQIPFYVCPGTSSWNSIAGRTDNCLENLRSAAEDGLRGGAIGYLNTDWGDDGHWQVLPVSYLGFAAGAAMSWACAANAALDFTAELDIHVFRDKSRVMGKLASDLGNAYQHGGWMIRNESFLFHLLQFPDDIRIPETMTVKSLGETRRYIESAASALDAARMDRPDASLIHDEFANTIRLLLHACDRGFALRQGTMEESRTRSRFAADLRIIIGEYERLWMGRNRVGGLGDSVRGLIELLLKTGEVLPSGRRSQM